MNTRGTNANGKKEEGQDDTGILYLSLGLHGSNENGNEADVIPIALSECIVRDTSSIGKATTAVASAARASKEGTDETETSLAPRQFAPKKKKKKMHHAVCADRPSFIPRKIKCSWTDEEDERLIELVEKYGAKKWRRIANEFPGRTGKQCRERWHNHLSPDIPANGFTGSGKWTLEEDIKFEEAFKLYGKQWVLVAQHVETRSPNQCKSHNQKLEKRRQKAKGA